jgi:hypothetical protein
MRIKPRQIMLATLTALVAGLTSGCAFLTVNDGYQCTMDTPSGKNVSVYKDIWGRDYYYENGAKVWVNEAGGTKAKDQPTTTGS